MTVILHLPDYEDGTEWSETSAYKIQTPGNYPQENTQQVFLCYSYCAFSCILYLNQQTVKIKLQQKYRKTRFVLGTNSYMFRQQGAIHREFNIKKNDPQNLK